VEEAQERLTRLSLEEAVDMTARAIPTLRPKQFEYQAKGANEITAGLRPNPTGNFLAEKFGGGSASQTQYTFSMGQPIELGGKRQRRLDTEDRALAISSECPQGWQGLDVA
jgi:hypothetical protein